VVSSLSISRILGKFLSFPVSFKLSYFCLSVSSTEFCWLIFVTSHPQILCHTVSMSQNGETMSSSFSRPSIPSSTALGTSENQRQIVNRCTYIVQEFRTGRNSKSKASYLLQQSIPHDSANEDLFLSTYKPYFNMLCHGPCLVTFFLKNNQRMAPTEPLMMATSPLFSATITTSHLRQTYIGAPSEYFLHSATTNTTCIHYQPAPRAFYHSTTTAPPCSTHVPCSRPITSCMHQSRGHELRSPQGPARIYVSILRHHPEYKSPCYMFILLPYAFTITPFMFMFCLCINTPVCCMYFASSNINLATYFSLTRSHLLKLLLGSTSDSPTPSGPPKSEASIKRAAQPTS